jgi:hypothetical protein
MGPSDHCRTFRSIAWPAAPIKRPAVDPHERTVIVGDNLGSSWIRKNSATDLFPRLKQRTALPVFQ